MKRRCRASVVMCARFRVAVLARASDFDAFYHGVSQTKSERGDGRNVHLP
jgi:hypothetical protein